MNTSNIKLTKIEKMLIRSRPYKIRNFMEATPHYKNNEIISKPRRLNCFDDLNIIDDIKEKIKFDMYDNNTPIRQYEKRCLNSPFVLVHGEKPFGLIQSYKDIPFSNEIKCVMNKFTKKKKIQPIQANVWPHLLSECSATIISDIDVVEKNYLIVPAISSIIIRLFKNNLITPETYGPCAIIISPNADNVTEIERLFNVYLLSYNSSKITKKKIEILSAYGKYKASEIKQKLLLGTGILITTPLYLLNLISENKYFDKNRLKLLTINNFYLCKKLCGDDSDIIEKIINYFYVLEITPQLIVISTIWDSELLKYSKYGYRHCLYISNYIETTIYGNVKYNINFIDNDANKMEAVLEFIKNKSNKRSLIVCSTESEVHNVSKYLLNLNIKCLIYTNDCDIIQKNTITDWFNNLNNNNDLDVLVCSDNVILDLYSFKSVDCIFNYSIPDNWTTFSFRFITLFNKYHDNFKNTKRLHDQETPLIYILIEKNNFIKEYLIQNFVDLICRIKNYNINGMLEEFFTYLNDSYKNQCESINFCSYFLSFGIQYKKCPKLMCNERHKLLPIDKSLNPIPMINSTIKIKMTFVHSPIHYSGQIISYCVPSSGTWNLYNKNKFEDYKNITLQLNKYYQNIQNLKHHVSVFKGDICVWSDNFKLFQRIKILNTTRELATFKFIDTGEILYNKPINTILKISNDLKDIPPLAIDIHHVGMVPFDKDLTWGRDAKQNVKYKIEEFENKIFENEECYFKIKCLFKIKNNIWTNKLTFVNNKNEEFPIHKTLLKNDFAERINYVDYIENLNSIFSL